MHFKFETNNSGEPLYKQAADYLSGLIRNGHLKPGEMLPSEIKLAEQLKISRLTLRKSLSILTAGGLICQRPHYGTFVADAAEKRLRIGILHYISDAEFTGFYGSQLLLQFCLLSTFFQDVELVFLSCPEKTQQAVLERIEKSNCDGFIIPHSTDVFSKILDQEKYDFLPLVYINKNNDYTEGKRYNVTLEEDPYKEAMAYLRRAGHKRIAYLCRILPYRHTQQRSESFLKHAPPEAIPVIKGSKLPWREYARRETLRLCSLPEPPTAIVSPGAAFTSGIIQGLMECRKVIPEDISVVGFDHPGNMFPALSTVDQPLREMAIKALSVIRDVIRGKVYRNHTFVFQSVFRDRGSISVLGKSTSTLQQGE